MEDDNDVLEISVPVSFEDLGLPPPFHMMNNNGNGYTPNTSTSSSGLNGCTGSSSSSSSSSSGSSSSDGSSSSGSGSESNSSDDEDDDKQQESGQTSAPDTPPVNGGNGTTSRVLFPPTSTPVAKPGVGGLFKSPGLNGFRIPKLSNTNSNNNNTNGTPVVASTSSAFRKPTPEKTPRPMEHPLFSVNGIGNGKLVSAGVVWNDDKTVNTTRRKTLSMTKRKIETMIENPQAKRPRGRPKKNGVVAAKKERKEMHRDPSFHASITFPKKKKVNNQNFKSNGESGFAFASLSSEQREMQIEERVNDLCISAGSMSDTSNGNATQSAVQSQNSSMEESDAELARSLQEEEDKRDACRSLRTRGNRVCLNEEVLFRVKDSVFFGESLGKSVGKKSGSSNTKSKKINNSGNIPVPQLPLVELDADTSETYLRWWSGKTADWDFYLEGAKPEYLQWIAPVDKFPNAPLATVWKDFAVPGTRVEVPNCFVNCSRPVYWVATVRMFAGYKALIDYETLGIEKKLFAWISYCSKVPKPLGYCDENGILLYPPEDIWEALGIGRDETELNIWDILRDHTKNDRTVHQDHINIVGRHITAKIKYRLGDVVEAMDCITSHRHRRCLAKVTAIICDRIHVTYLSCAGKSHQRKDGGIFNAYGDGIRPVGFSKKIGVELIGYPDNAPSPKIDFSLLPPVPEDVFYKRGMVCEVIHPYFWNRIAACEILRVLKHGYIIMKIECNSPLPSSLTFLYHITSPMLLQCGFAEEHDIPLAVPLGESEKGFEWDKYCKKKKLEKLDLSPLLPRASNPFRVGEKFEAVDLRQPQYSGPVTVIRVVEHLILLHFDGWPRNEEQALQWVPSDSPEIYPTGWSEMVGQEYQGCPDPPREEDNPVRLNESA